MSADLTPAAPEVSPGAPAALSADPRRKAALRYIFVSLALDVLGFGLLIPVGPKLVESLLHGGAGGTKDEAAPIVGSLMATWYFMSFLCAPILGVLSDRFGRRPVILLAMLGSGFDFFAQALSPNIAVLFITRAINGVTGASFTVASAYVADITPPEKRAAAFGMIGAAFGIGFVLGPALGGLLGQYDVRLPFYVAGGISILNALWGVFVLPESLPRERRAPIRLSRANPIGAYASLTRYPFVFAMAGSLFLLNLAQFILHATWALYTSHRYGWDTWHVGLSLCVVGIAAAIVQGGLARRIIPALGEPRALVVGIAIGVLSYLGYALAPEGWMIYAILAVGSIGGISQPACMSLITRTVGPTEQGSVQGALTSLQSLAGIAGPIIGGSVLARFIGPTPPFDLPGAAFVLSSLLCFFGLLIAMWAVSRTRHA
ncbi:MAG: TCR/Tet family MFS transporter [Phycisphaerales bacterium]